MPAGTAHPEFHNALGPGQRLAEFEIRGIVGVGGFGIVYLAYDHVLQREVAVKEYLPASLARRHFAGLGAVAIACRDLRAGAAVLHQ